LLRDDFVRFVDVVEGANGAPMAVVDWQRAVVSLDDGQLVCSSSEGQVLRLAASIAEGMPVDLGEAVCALDETNALAVARALLHAAGHRELGIARECQ
jgi:hypothetical protein